MSGDAPDDAVRPDAAAVWLDAAWAGPGLFAPPIPFDPADRGLLLADGAFDTALVLGHRMVWRERHVARLVAACAALGFLLEPARVERAIDALLPRVARGALRLTATRGPGPRGLRPPTDPRPTLIATAVASGGGMLFAPIRLRTAAARRNETSALSRLKALGYGDAVLAAADAAKAAGSMRADDALFLNTRGRVACAGAANLFALVDGDLVTPPLADGVLDGIARGVLLAVAPRVGVRAQERSLAPADLHRAAAVLATSSLRLVAPVVALDGRPIQECGLGEHLADAVAEAVRADCGSDPRAAATPAD